MEKLNIDSHTNKKVEAQENVVQPAKNSAEQSALLDFNASTNRLSSFWEKAKVSLNTIKGKVKTWAEREATLSLKLINYEQNIKDQEKKLEDVKKLEEKKKELEALSEKTTMIEVANMIERTGIKVEGGNQLFVEALKNGEVPNNLLLKSIEIITNLEKDQNWNDKNKRSIEFVKKKLASKVNWVSIGKAKNEKDKPIFKEYIATAQKKEIYNELSKLILLYKPLHISPAEKPEESQTNQDLANTFNKPGWPNRDALQAGLKAVQKLKSMVKGEQKKVLDSAEIMIKKDLGL